MLLLENKRNKGLLNTLHFVGIGGIGMSGIAEVMYNLGYKIQGSDLAENNNTKRLKKLGVKVFNKHDPKNINNVSYVVISSAIKFNNPELQYAREHKIPIIRRAEMLAELMRFKCSIAVSGSHGKTTTTSMVACLFEAARLHPTVINGGIINNRSTNAYLGSGDYLIAEADESDATFIHIPATVAIITNIDPEHLDFYGDFDSLNAPFKCFITNLPFYGFAVLCIDHPIVRDIATTTLGRKIITYGIDSDDANIQACNIRFNNSSTTFDLKIKDYTKSPEENLKTKIFQDITIPALGKHNVLNSLAAISVGLELDFDIAVIKNGFDDFKGVKRRFTKTGEYNGAEIIDDYAHHPVEIKATLDTAKTITNQRNGRVIAIFQPHRYSRLKHLFADFISCFDDADEIYITDVFAAGEKEIENMNSQTLVAEIAKKNNKKVSHLKTTDSLMSNLVEIITQTAENGDLFVFMGAGNITNFANQILKEINTSKTRDVNLLNNN
ncbi:MAG: UDP-N-acetylmuramate--L-alanine ligase [Rickettsiaceae bacterium]|nr:UDP-N-acetylmuramate--L-alanine ligase [Rickettsiaceae bacterium]